VIHGLLVAAAKDVAGPAVKSSSAGRRPKREKWRQKELELYLAQRDRERHIDRGR
jgi:hypothetical protein